MNPLRRVRTMRGAQTPAHPPKVTRPGAPQPGSHPGPADFKTFRRLRIAKPNDFQAQSAHPGWAPPGACPASSPSAVPGPGVPDRSGALRLSCRGTYSASPGAPPRSLQSGRRGHSWNKGKLRRREGQLLAQGYTARRREAGRTTVGWAPPPPLGSLSPFPAGYSQPVLPTSSRTSSDVEWAAPMVPRGNLGRASLAGPGLAPATQQPVAPRVHRGPGRRGSL